MNISSVLSTSRRFVGLGASPPDDEDAPGVEVGRALTSFSLGRGRGRSWFNESAISANTVTGFNLPRRLFVGNLTTFGRSIAGHAFVTGVGMT
jgi:hypothetical protein